MTFSHTMAMEVVCLQHVRNHRIKELDGCASAILIGCCSGALYLNGSYTPSGAPLDFLEGGSSFLVSNLWEVGDIDASRFGKTMLNTWMTIGSTTLADCGLCIGDKRKRKEEADTRDIGCKHRPRIWSSMTLAREACSLKFLTGAAAVIYGVPTCIKGSKNSLKLSSQINYDVLNDLFDDEPSPKRNRVDNGYTKGKESGKKHNERNDVGEEEDLEYDDGEREGHEWNYENEQGMNGYGYEV
ncbi:separin protein [Orobanche hederae]